MNICMKVYSSILFRYPMVSYCVDPPKLCVGTRTGVLALYDLKTPKYQVSISSPPPKKTHIFDCLAIPSSSEK